MSEHARLFLEHWKLEHIEPVPDVRRLRETVRLVAKCRRDASAAGVEANELRAAAEGNLIESMLAALAAADRPEMALANPEPADGLVNSAFASAQNGGVLRRIMRHLR